MNGSAASGGPSLIRAKPSASSICLLRSHCSTAAASCDHLGAQRVGRALDGAEAGDRELARVGAREAGVRVEEGVVAGPDVHLVGRAAEDVGDHLGGGRLVALSLRHGPERDHDLAEDVELHGRRLVVARELELRVEQLSTGRSCSCRSRASSRSRCRAASRASPPRRAAPRSCRSRSARARCRGSVRSRRSRRRSRSASRTASARS